MFLCLSKFAGSSKTWLILCGTHGASMTFRRKPFRRMRHIVEYDITSNAAIRRNYVERQFVECKSVENSSKVRRKLVVI